MIEFCMVLPIAPGKKIVHVKTCKHPRKVKKHRVSDISIHMNPVVLPNISKIVSVAPSLLIGDATFVYVDRRKNDEYERAVYACKREGSMSGSYRTADGQVATSIRLGDKECLLQVTASDGIIEISPQWGH